MRNNSEDQTIVRNYLSKYKYLIKEYELVKSGNHERFRYVKDFYKFYDTDRRSFLKYYNRYKQSGDELSLLPQKRGPKWSTRRTSLCVEKLVVSLREKGMNRYEIVHVLKTEHDNISLSPSGVYKIIRRYGLNKLKKPMKEEKRRIIKEKAGELAHIDCHHLSKSLIRGGESKKRYLVCVIDSCTRIAWVELIDDIKSLTVMFATMRCFNMIGSRYDIRFVEALTDNGPEFGTRNSKKKDSHPFERMLMETGVTHRYTQPYRPQTNGKVERFWKTLNEDLIEDTDFDSIDEFKDELLKYLIYYNEHRPHQGINGNTPKKINDSCPRIT